MMKWVLRGLGVATLGMVGTPAVVSFVAPARKPQRGELWRSLGLLQKFPVGEVRQAAVDVPSEDWGDVLHFKGVYVWRPNEEEIVVFSRSCTDLGCPVNWDPGSECYFCPCHGGIFAKDGERMAGPPPRPLYRYENRVRGGELEINLRSLPPMV